MEKLFVVRLGNGLYRKVHPTLDSPAVVTYAEAVKMKAGNSGSTIEDFHPFEIYPTEFAEEE